MLGKRATVVPTQPKSWEDHLAGNVRYCKPELNVFRMIRGMQWGIMLGVLNCTGITICAYAPLIRLRECSWITVIHLSQLHRPHLGHTT